VVRFNRSFAHIEPQKFIKDILVKELGVRAVFVGEDFRFGKDRSGDIALFQKLGVQYGYEMHAVDQLKQARTIISSSRVRQFVMEGKLNQAQRLLGRRFSISGTVVKGARRGRTLGYPTANVGYAVIHPPRGVYFVHAWLGKKSYPAIANIGTRPSFEKQNIKLYLEVHILDFSKNIYGRRMQVEFIKKIRNEKKFAAVPELIRQIQKDEALARQLNRSL
jgi:riboflavin kinase/FMN adenylyltransferase